MDNKFNVKKGENKNRESTTWLLFQVVLLMLSFVSLIVVILTFHSIVVNLNVLISPNEITLETFYFSDSKSFSVGSRGGQTIEYKFYGNHPLYEKPLIVSVSNIELKIKEIEEIITKKNAKIWLLNNKNHNFGVLQKVYPTKKDLSRHVFISLIFIFFGPLFTIILFFTIFGKDFLNMFKDTSPNLQNMEKTIIFLFLFPLGLSAQNQSTEYQAYPITLCKEITNEGSFYVYDPPFKAKGEYSEFSEVENAYPEQVLQSVMSATSQEWVDYNTYGGAENSKKKPKSFFAKAKTRDRDENYYELVGKFEFTMDGQQYAVIKSYLKVDQYEDHFPSALLFIKEGNRWYKKRGKEEAMLIYFFSNYQLETIQAIIENQKTDDAFITKCQKAMHKDGFFDFNLTPYLLGQLKTSNNIFDIKKHLEWFHWPKN